MSTSLPTPLRALLGLAALAVEEARKIPETLPGSMTAVPVEVISAAMQASLKFQQQMAALASKGDEVLSQLRGPSEEPPAWATFDDDATDTRPVAAFDRVSPESTAEGLDAERSASFGADHDADDDFADDDADAFARGRLDDDVDSDVVPRAGLVDTPSDDSASVKDSASTVRALAKQAPAKKAAARKAPARRTESAKSGSAKPGPAMADPAMANPAMADPDRQASVAADRIKRAAKKAAVRKIADGRTPATDAPLAPAIPPPSTGPAVPPHAAGPALPGPSGGPAAHIDT